MTGVQRPLTLDLRELIARTVVRLDRPTQLAVQRLDLTQHTLRLGALGRNLGRLSADRARQK